jgi:hypothetical protein
MLEFFDSKAAGKHRREASSSGLTLLGYAQDQSRYRPIRYRNYKFNDCGHVQDIHIGAVRAGKAHFKCRTCQENLYKNEASSLGLEYLGKAETQDKDYRSYKFACCGAVRDMQVGNVRSGHFSCPKCPSAKSKGEDAVAAALDELGVGYVREQPLVGFRSNPLRFDFFTSNRTALEFDGKQHFDYSPHFDRSFTSFQQRLDNDGFKDQYCLANGIRLIRIHHGVLDAGRVPNAVQEALRLEIEEPVIVTWRDGELQFEGVANFNIHSFRLPKGC